MPPIAVQRPLRIGIAGLGRMGMYHLQRLSLREDFETIASYDVNPSRAESAGIFGCGFHESWADFLARPDIELVLVATPPATHAELAIEALGAGKHVVVEKPLCLSVPEADAMQEAARRSGRMLSVVQNRRWDDDFRAALAAVRSGELGRLLAAKLIVWSYGFPNGGRPHRKTGWRTDPQRGGGVLLEFGAHYFDQLLLLAAGEPQHVFAQFPAHGSDAGSEDGFSAFVSFPDGMTAQIEVNLGSIAPLRTGWTLSGTRGGYAKFRRYSQTEQGEIFDVPSPPVSTDWDRFYDTLALHLRENASLPVTTQQARRVVGLIEGARQSARSGQVARLPRQVSE